MESGSVAKSFLESIVEVLRGRIAEFIRYLCGRPACIQQGLAGEQEALFGQIAEDGGPEHFFKPAFELVFVETYGPCDLGEIGRGVEPLVDEIADGEEFLLVGRRFDERFPVMGVCGGGAAGFGAKNQQLDTFGEEEQLLQMAPVGMIGYLADQLLYGGVHCAPVFGKNGAPACQDMVRKMPEDIAGIVGKLQESVAGELDAEGFEFEGAVLDGHVEITRVQDIVMTADEMEIRVQLAAVEAVIAFEPDVQTNDVGMGAMRGEAGESMETGNGMAQTDAVDVPGAGVAGTLGSEEVLGVVHAIDAIPSGGGR